MIPARGHFIWLGKQLPWVYLLALRSAARRAELTGGLVLHHTDDLSAAPVWDELQRVRGLELRRVEPSAVLEVGSGGLAPRLVDLYRQLDAPASRANMLRAGILAAEGGVYLDFDTVTVKSLRPLLGSGVFCGAERIVFPAAVRRSRRPDVLLGALARTTARDLLRRAPGGWAAFRSIAEMYPAAVNNAVIGAQPGHALIIELLQRMADMPAEQRLRRFALGTHLLQDVTGSYSGKDLRICAPDVFFPLGPEISEHWFRRVRRVELERMLAPETRVVHWYASVRTREHVRRLSPAWVRAHATTQPFSALALAFVDER